MFDIKLVFLLVICVIFMVWLGIEGFALFTRSNQQLLSMRLGLGKVVNNEFVMKTASDFASASAYKTASNWEGDNRGDRENIYRELIDGRIREDDIRRMDRDPESRLDPKKGFLSYFDSTDYSPGSPSFRGSSSGSYLVRTTGSRFNDLSYIDQEFYNQDSRGGRHLIQCSPNDFNCIRNLSYSDSSYQPFDRMQFSGVSTDRSSTPAAADMDRSTFDQQVQRALQVLLQSQNRQQQTQGTAAPSGTSTTTSTVARNAGSANPADTDLAACLSECLKSYNITTPTLQEL